MNGVHLFEPTGTAVNAYIENIDQQVANRSLLLHPFYLSWSQGTLSKEALCDYAAQYSRHVSAFPTYLSSLHAHTEDSVTRRHILANLVDEEGGHPNHPDLWLDFAEAVGAMRTDVERTEPWKETIQLVETFRTICRDRSTAEGLAALYAYESQIPAVAESKIDGLTKFYGIDDSRALAYFRVHIEADREHAAVERKLLEGCVNESNFGAVHQSVSNVLDALWEMLSGVCRRHAIPNSSPL
jgi:pyrroloquinoline-quinone synthase